MHRRGSRRTIRKTKKKHTHTPIKRFFWVPTANSRRFQMRLRKNDHDAGALYRCTSREILNNFIRSCNWRIENVCASSTELTYNTHIYKVNEYTYVVVSQLPSGETRVVKQQKVEAPENTSCRSMNCARSYLRLFTQIGFSIM